MSIVYLSTGLLLKRGKKDTEEDKKGENGEMLPAFLAARRSRERAQREEERLAVLSLAGDLSSLTC